jgi:hypothetical protein
VKVFRRSGIDDLISAWSGASKKFFDVLELDAASFSLKINNFYVIKGTGIDDINNAFDGSLTFQPAVPSGEVDIVVSC